MTATATAVVNGNSDGDGDGDDDGDEEGDSGGNGEGNGEGAVDLLGLGIVPRPLARRLSLRMHEDDDDREVEE